MERLDSMSDLLDLQAVDLEIDRLLNRRQGLPELDQYRAAHEELTELEATHTQDEQRLRELNLALDKTNGELTIGEEKLAAEQNRLYAGGLSARDADYLRQEVDMLGRKNTEMEDQVLELMEQREEQQKAVEALAAEIATKGEFKAALEHEIQASWKEIDAELARKETRKADIVPLVAEDLLELYEDLRPVKEGVAVGRLAEGVCGGCHLTLTAAEQLSVSRQDPPRCIHCRRILVL
ncbi:MAG: zinc ribbon domain-containing protein [Acidimicrobiia bacterium]